MHLVLCLLFFANGLFYDGEIVEAKIGESPPLELEVVTSQKSTVQGLSGRDEIGHDGMLFVYAVSRRYAFWMKDMYFNLDIIWLHDGIVIDVAHDVKAPTPGQTHLLLVQPRGPANMVLELNSGRAKAWNIQRGSRFTLL